MVGAEDGELVSGVLRSAREHRIAHRALSASEVKDRFGIFSLDDSLSCIHEEGAGVLFPEECIGGYVSLATLAGAEFRFREPLTRWRTTREGIELDTPRETYLADKVVFAMGAWTPNLVGGVVPLWVERQVPFWFRHPPDPSYEIGKMPIFMVEEADGRMFYGIPDVGQGVKVARHHGGARVAPERVERQITDEDLEPVREFVRRRLKGLDPEPSLSTTCLYSNTPDRNFVIDFHPQESRMLLVSACSGHGFKFASVIGEIGADLMTTGSTKHDISFANLQRFVGPGKNCA